MTAHRHIAIPACDTSHPDNPIPSDPTSIPVLSSANSPRADSTSALSHSSADSLKTSEASSSSINSDTLLTPPTELAQDASASLETLNVTDPPFTSGKRRASTHVLSTKPTDLRKFLQDDSSPPDSNFLKNYCCGGGCCMLEKEENSTTTDENLVRVRLPDNDAFRALGLLLNDLSLDSSLTKTVDLPETTVKLLPLASPDTNTTSLAVDVHPPSFLQPHAPYSVFPAPLHHARQLTKPGAEKRTYHFDLDITDYPEEGGVDFKVGGAIGICPPNDPILVDNIFEQLGIPRFQRDKHVTLKTQRGRWPTIWGDEEARELVTTRRELLTWCSDISSTAPTKALLRVLAEHAGDENEKKILLYLCSAQGQASFCDLRTGSHIILAQLLHAFPSSKPPLESLFVVLNPIMPRFYSLSNDPFESSARQGLAGRRLIEIAVTVHETLSWAGGVRTGVGSGFLERRARQFIDENKPLTIPVFRGLMANPLSREFANDGPMMLIGAGVGMAPFRGFILNRLRNANCANKIWLIQGVRDSTLDEIYRGELGHHEHDIKKVVQSRVSGPEAAGVSTNDVKGPVVVSATKNAKTAKYVQDEVRCQADVVWFVLNALDGRIFVCGSTKGMGEGVEDALIDVVIDKGGLNDDEAKQFLDKKREAGQYIAETW